MSERRTCSVCKHHKFRCHCEKFNVYADGNGFCDGFERKETKSITNGDMIRQGSDKELVLYKHTWSCEVCIYHDKKDLKKHCKRPHEKVCLDGMIAWLNAPADAPDTNVDTKESEVKDEPLETNEKRKILSLHLRHWSHRGVRRCLGWKAHRRATF